MTILKGGDSAIPQPSLYAGHDIWCWYVAGDTPHVWSKAEVAELGAHGVKGTLPIVVPPQDSEWWLDNDGYPTLEALVRDALAWGIPAFAPLVLDVEEAQAEKIPGTNAMHAWAVACRAHLLVPWTYSNADLLARDPWANKWLAKWTQSAAADPQMPAEMSGWQYASGTDMDFSIFEAERDYLTPDLTVVNLGASAAPAPGPVVSEVVAHVEQDESDAEGEISAANAEMKTANLTAAKAKLLAAVDELTAAVHAL